jgi:hypothetical protein
MTSRPSLTKRRIAAYEYVAKRRPLEEHELRRLLCLIWRERWFDRRRQRYATDPDYRRQCSEAVTRHRRAQREGRA